MKLLIEHIPPEAKSIAIIVDDPDVTEGSFCHWLIWNLPVTRHIIENETRGAQGMNDFSHHKYNGPCKEYGGNRYFFKVYALDTKLEIPVSSCKADLERAMSDHVIGFGFIVGRYEKS
jgi:Raf kinase inhibitor-like YbhB/YbcL family protein